MEPVVDLNSLWVPFYSGYSDSMIMTSDPAYHSVLNFKSLLMQKVDDLDFFVMCDLYFSKESCVLNI